MDRVDRDTVVDAAVLLAVFSFMLWTRFRTYSNFIRPDKVYLAGNDAYYHLREINYVVRHWPWTMPFDPWTNFPLGSAQGQFGTLFDVSIATVSIIAGAGSPSPRLIMIMTAIAPAIFGSLVVFPIYAIGRHIGGRMTGLSSAVLLAMIPGVFYRRSLVGSADHNIAEVLFQVIAVLAIIVAISVAKKDSPVWENIIDMDFQPLRRTAIYSTAAGVAIALYILVWPPGVVLVGLLGVYYLVALTYLAWKQKASDTLAITGIISMAVTGIVLVPFVDVIGLSPTMISLLQIALPLAVVTMAIYLVELDRRWSRSDQDYYLVAVIASIIGGFALMAVVTPSLFQIITANIDRVFTFGATGSTRTIAEARSIPFGQLTSFLFQQYGLLTLSAVAGIILLIKRWEGDSFLLVWSAGISLMAFNQVRFHYYMAAVVAILSAIAFGYVIDGLDLSSFKEIEPYQIFAIAAIGIFVFGPLAPPLGSPSVMTWSSGPGDVTLWSEPLDWVASETPDPGLDYYGTYERTEDFDYPDSSYGVLSWWDYGHWITVEGERMAVANPFQQHVLLASRFFLATNESNANEIIGSPTADEPVRYVMIDYAMAGRKFGAIATWTGPEPSTYYSQQQRQIADTTATLYGIDDDYRQTMMTRLYMDDARGLSHYRLVHESNQSLILASVAQRTSTGFRSTGYVNRVIDNNIYQTVVGRSDLEFYDANREAAVKTFEYVPGATIVGSSNSSTVTAMLELRTNTGRRLIYVQIVEVTDGQFRMTVPYATSPIEGSAITPTSNYTVISNDTVIGHVNVTEEAIQNAYVVGVSA